jgi:hypothetical protein
MRVVLLTLAIMLGMEADLQVLMWAMALLSAAAVAMFLGFMFRPAAKRRVQEDDRKWRGVHREREEPGRHAPARGKRLQGLSRQAQLEERTVYVTPAVLLRPSTDPLKETTEAWLAPEPHVHTPYRDGVRIRCRTCKLDLDQPEGMPEVGAGGVHTWDHPKRNGKGA